ncbi:MAG: HD domain-containing protein [Caldithrix sp.]|nr:HD domain-containing protein [Caldithrix sp.]
MNRKKTYFSIPYFLLSRIIELFLIALIASSLFSVLTPESLQFLYLGLAIKLVFLVSGPLILIKSTRPYVHSLHHIYAEWLVTALFFLPLIAANALYLILPLSYITLGTMLYKRKDYVPFLIFLTVSLVIISISAFVLDFINVHIITIIGINTTVIFTSLLISNLTQPREDYENKLRASANLVRPLQNKLTETRKLLEREQKTVEKLNRNIKKRDLEIKNIITLSDQLNVKEDSKKKLTRFILTLMGQLGAKHAVIMTQIEPHQNFLTPYVSKGLDNNRLNKLRIYLDSEIINILKGVYEPLFVNQIPTQALYRDEIDLLKRFRNDLMVPLVQKNQFLGIIIIGDKINNQAFSKEEFDMLTIFARQMVFIIEQARVSDEFQQFYAGTVRALLRSLETKYRYARGHNLRTAKAVNALARRMQLDVKTVIDYSYGALLHDVGKIAIKDKYLFNNAIFDSPSAPEKQKILEHTIEGSKILKSAGFNQTIIDLALHHHEFYNGHGYPHHIGSEELTLGSRMLSVCNAYDAITSDRPHRRALSVNTAKEILIKNSGSQFDPEMVHLLMDEIKQSPNLFSTN